MPVRSWPDAEHSATPGGGVQRVTGLGSRETSPGSTVSRWSSSNGCVLQASNTTVTWRKGRGVAEDVSQVLDGDVRRELRAAVVLGEEDPGGRLIRSLGQSGSRARAGRRSGRPRGTPGADRNKCRHRPDDGVALGVHQSTALASGSGIRRRIGSRGRAIPGRALSPVAVTATPGGRPGRSLRRDTEGAPSQRRTSKASANGLFSSGIRSCRLVDCVVLVDSDDEGSNPSGSRRVWMANHVRFRGGPLRLDLVEHLVDPPVGAV